MKKIFKKKTNTNFLLIFLVSAILGLSGGVVGQIFSRSYITNDIYKIPYWGEIDLNNTRNRSLIISEPKKVIVEENEKIKEISNSINNSIVGIFRKKTDSENSQKFDINNYYRLNDERGQGLVITSDGWILTSAFSPNVRGENDILNNYVIITKADKVYSIDKVLRENNMMFGFVHASGVKDLTPVKLAEDFSSLGGSEILSMNWDEEKFITYISSVNKNDEIVKSTDYYKAYIQTTNDLPANFIGSPVFNLSGEALAVSNNEGKLESILDIKPAIKSLLEYQEIRRASLGVYYTNLDEFLIEEGQKQGAYITKNENGISVVKNSPAEFAGLTEGDIILSIDNVEINQKNDLNEILQKYLAGDIISLRYQRDGAEKEMRVQLANAN